MSKIRVEIHDTMHAVIIIYVRNALLHIIITQGSKTNLYSIFNIPDKEHEHKIALQFWNVFEVTCLLYTVGWVGEAGAMAIAAEAFGLGISINDQLGLGAGINTISSMFGMSRGTSNRSGNGDIFPSVVLPTGGISQVLLSVQLNSDNCIYSGSTLLVETVVEYWFSKAWSPWCCITFYTFSKNIDFRDTKICEFVICR